MSKGLEPTIVLKKNEEGWWTARDATRGLTTQGETRDEALANLDDVIDAIENDAGRLPTDEEFWEADIDPDVNRRVESGVLPDVLK